MRIITLTTDLGYRDPYLALVKARLFAGPDDLRVIDLSCEIKNNSIRDAAFIVKNALPSFPPDTVHLISVKNLKDKSENGNQEKADNSRFLLTRYANQYIITPDNGLFTLLDKNFKEPIYQLFYSHASQSHFFLKDVFVDAALELIAGKSMADLGVLTSDFFVAYDVESYVSGKTLRGAGVYVDDFGNICTNISRERWDEVVGAKSFSVTLPGARITTLSNTYEEVTYGGALLLFNSFGFLEVAFNGNSAFELLHPNSIGTQFKFSIVVEFND